MPGREVSEEAGDFMSVLDDLYMSNHSIARRWLIEERKKRKVDARHDGNT